MFFLKRAYNHPWAIKNNRKTGTGTIFLLPIFSLLNIPNNQSNKKTFTNTFGIQRELIIVRRVMNQPILVFNRQRISLRGSLWIFPFTSQVREYWHPFTVFESRHQEIHGIFHKKMEWKPDSTQIPCATETRRVCRHFKWGQVKETFLFNKRFGLTESLTPSDTIGKHHEVRIFTEAPTPYTSFLD